MSEEHMESAFTVPPEPGPEDGDMTRLVLQHCVMPAYQFIIQVAPDQNSVGHVQKLFPALIHHTHMTYPEAKAALN